MTFIGLRTCNPVPRYVCCFNGTAPSCLAESTRWTDDVPGRHRLRQDNTCCISHSTIDLGRSRISSRDTGVEQSGICSDCAFTDHLPAPQLNTLLHRRPLNQLSFLYCNLSINISDLITKKW